METVVMGTAPIYPLLSLPLPLYLAYLLDGCISGDSSREWRQCVVKVLCLYFTSLKTQNSWIHNMINEE